jgi:glycosyltransferase involved in cell wall biosynthesis
VVWSPGLSVDDLGYSSHDFPDELRGALRNQRGHGLLITRNNLGLHGALSGQFSAIEWHLLTKETMRGWGIRRILAALRERRWDIVVIEDTAPEMTRRADLYACLLLLARTRIRWLITSSELTLQTRVLQPAKEWPRLVYVLAREAWASLQAIVYGYRLLRQASPPGPGRAHPSRGIGNIAMLRTQFWFQLVAGGSVSHVRGVASGMRALGLVPHLWTSSKLPGSELEFEQTEITPEPPPNFFEDAAMVAFNRTVIRQAGQDFRTFSPAVVYQRHDVFSLSGLILARQLGVPLVLEVNASEVWARETWSRLFLKDLARKMEGAAFRNADRLVLISEELVTTVLDLGGHRDRIVVNPNGVDVDRFDPDPRTEMAKGKLGVPAETILCGFIGTFAKWHGVLFLAEQIPGLLRRNPRLGFVLIGDGDLRPDVIARLDQGDIGSRVLLPGMVTSEQVPGYLAACDILLSPHMPFDDGTTFFGSPTKLFEYMAAGRAIAASKLGPIARILNHGQTAILFDPGDGAGFCEAVLELADRPELRRTLGMNARAVAESQYTWTANARRALEGLVELPL